MRRFARLKINLTKKKFNLHHDRRQPLSGMDKFRENLNKLKNNKTIQFER